MTTEIKIKKNHDEVLAKRLAHFREKFIDKSQNMASKKLGVSQSNLSNMEAGNVPIRLEFITKLSKEYKLNQAWLTTGKGNPQKNTTGKSTPESDLNEMSVALSNIQKGIKMFELTQSHLANKIEALEKKIEELEGKLNQK